MRQTPTSPVKADFRFMLNLLKGQPYKPTPVELDKVSRVFARAGGSWERLFQGSVLDITLLRKVLKVAGKKGYLSKASDWST